MHLTILGATGRIGSLALNYALAAGHTITTLSRSGTGSIPADERLIVVKGDIADATAMRQAVEGSEAVVAALGPRSNTLEAELALEIGMRNLVAAMTGAGVSRLVALSGAAVDAPGDAKPVIDRVVSRFVRVAARHVVGAKQREFAVFTASDLEWTALRPPLVTDGEARGYHLSEHLRPGARVTRADVAAALIDQLADRGFVRAAPFVLPGSRVVGAKGFEPSTS
ncbi:MAG: NAD(P)H-binding protein [Chloroflexota bacterium]